MTRVYVDVDDVLSETARGMLAVLEARTGRRAHLEDWTHFDPRRSFGLTDDECEDFMAASHADAVLEALAPVVGAADGLVRLGRLGARVEIVTGRPPNTLAATRRWLHAARMPFGSLAVVDKYGRHASHPEAVPLAQLTGAGFDLAVEDSPTVAAFLAEHAAERVVLLDRPWNRDPAHFAELAPAALRRIRRVADWSEIG